MHHLSKKKKKSLFVLANLLAFSVCVACVCVHGCPWICALSMFHTNPEICNAALHWPGAGRQLCRNWVTWDARTLLWRWAPLHTQHWQEVTATLCPQSNLNILQSLIGLHVDSVNPPWDFLCNLLLCCTIRPLMSLSSILLHLLVKAWPWSTMQRKSFTSWDSRTSWRVWSPSWSSLQNSNQL